MFRLKKYLKPYIGLILLAILLLFGQGMAELNLPNLMSDIVNVGIQYSGIENSSPEAISENGMTLVKTFMTADEKKTVESCYKQITAQSEDYKTYKDKYSYLNDKTASVYVLKDNLGNTTRADLDRIFGNALMTFVSIMRDFSKESSSVNTDSTSITDVDLTKLYQVQPMLNMLPQETIQKARDKAVNSDETISDSVGRSFVKMFYEEVGISVSGIQSAYIFRIGAFMVLITLGSAVCAILVGLIASVVGAGVAKKLRKDLFEKIEYFSSNEFDKFSTASLITRTTNDITQVQMLITMSLRMIFYAPIVGIGGIVMALSSAVSMTWIIALAIVVLIGILLVVCCIALPKFNKIQKLIDRLNLVTRESLSGMMVIRAFGTEEHEEERFDEANKNLTKVDLFINRVMTFLMPAMMLVMNSVSLLIVWVASHQIEQGSMQIGDMMAFIQYSMMIIMSFLVIAMMFIMVPRAAVSAVRIADVLECENSVKDKENPTKFPEKVKGEIVFDHVSFKYEDAGENVLTDISFTAKPGQTTAFIGSTGSGKSTLVNLIPRFYDVTEGKITFDGIDIRDLSQHDLRENIGLVPQKGVLFTGDIASNLRYGKHDATDKEIQTAAAIAQAEEFIDAKPEKYQTPIAQGGTNVSGGQKQRLAIARALVKQAPVYIFDDSFSALDFKTDAALRKALKKYTGNATVLIVAQRISTIMNAEQIIVLDEGKIVGKGTHKELLKTCAEYKEIAMSQLKSSELE